MPISIKEAFQKNWLFSSSVDHFAYMDRFSQTVRWSCAHIASEYPNHRVTTSAKYEATQVEEEEQEKHLCFMKGKENYWSYGGLWVVSRVIKMNKGRISFIRGVWSRGRFANLSLIVGVVPTLPPQAWWRNSIAKPRLTLIPITFNGRQMPPS